VLLAPLFDIFGPRKMIAGTYAVSGLLLSVTALLLGFDAFTAWTQTIVWMVIFFFASAMASSAYLTVSEIFPLEARGFAIAIFYFAGPDVLDDLGPYEQDLHLSADKVGQHGRTTAIRHVY
jgi:MFS family permease